MVMSGWSVNITTHRAQAGALLEGENIWMDRVSKPGHLALESYALPTALRGPASGTKPILRMLL